MLIKLRSAHNSQHLLGCRRVWQRETLGKDLGELREIYGNNPGEIPEAFGSLQLLSILFLSIGILTGTIPKAIGDLSALMTLHFNANTLTGRSQWFGRGAHTGGRHLRIGDALDCTQKPWGGSRLS